MSHRQPLICGNWKMHKTVAESLELATAIKNAVGPTCMATRSRWWSRRCSPPCTRWASGLRARQVALAAQDCFWEPQGAFTGEVSAHMLNDVGCSYVIVGHSERRQHFGEIDAAVNLKAKAVLKAGMRPIICIGETEKERDAGEVRGRLYGAARERACSASPQRCWPSTVVAYEPVWAIGTGRVATHRAGPGSARFHPPVSAQQFGEVAKTVRILYGGSVKPNNIAGLMAQPDVDGALVGGASLKAEEFLQIVRYNEAPAS